MCHLQGKVSGFRQEPTCNAEDPVRSWAQFTSACPVQLTPCFPGSHMPNHVRRPTLRLLHHSWAISRSCWRSLA